MARDDDDEKGLRGGGEGGKIVFAFRIPRFEARKGMKEKENAMPAVGRPTHENMKNGMPEEAGMTCDVATSEFNYG